ncbi:MAG: hypothetical protein NTW87_00985 [Planctomycetota bacterium]|nr:hypothetical protein [Planctomycetota bacterium]
MDLPYKPAAWYKDLEAGTKAAYRARDNTRTSDALPERPLALLRGPRFSESPAAIAPPQSSEAFRVFGSATPRELFAQAISHCDIEDLLAQVTRSLDCPEWGWSLGPYCRALLGIGPTKSLVEDEIAALRYLEPGWNGPKSPAISSEAIDDATDWARTLETFRPALPWPKVGPTTNGGVILQWFGEQTEGRELELVFRGTGVIEVLEGM